jgi:hypothetical protein
MAKTKVTWVKLVRQPQVDLIVTQCQRCDTVESIKLPLDATALAIRLKVITKNHANCKPK